MATIDFQLEYWNASRDFRDSINAYRNHLGNLMHVHGNYLCDYLPSLSRFYVELRFWLAIPDDRQPDEEEFLKLQQEFIGEIEAIPAWQKCDQLQRSLREHLEHEFRRTNPEEAFKIPGSDGDMRDITIQEHAFLDESVIEQLVTPENFGIISGRARDFNQAKYEVSRRYVETLELMEAQSRSLPISFKECMRFMQQEGEAKRDFHKKLTSASNSDEYRTLLKTRFPNIDRGLG